MGDKLFKIIGTGAALGASMLAKKVSEGGWKAVMASEPPANPEDPDTEMYEAILSAVFSGAVIALVRMLVSRKVTQYYTKSTGRRPANANDVG